VCVCVCLAVLEGLPVSVEPFFCLA